MALSAPITCTRVLTAISRILSTLSSLRSSCTRTGWLSVASNTVITRANTRGWACGLSQYLPKRKCNDCQNKEQRSRLCVCVWGGLSGGLKVRICDDKVAAKLICPDVIAHRKYESERDESQTLAAPPSTPRCRTPWFSSLSPSPWEQCTATNIRMDQVSCRVTHTGTRGRGSNTHNIFQLDTWIRT